MSSTDPIVVADAVAAQAAATKVPQFLIIYASIVDGKSWCGDCRASEPIINSKFPKDDPERPLTVHYAGDKET